MSAQSQKFRMFERKLSLGVRSPSSVYLPEVLRGFIENLNGEVMNLLRSFVNYKNTVGNMTKKVTTVDFW